MISRSSFSFLIVLASIFCVASIARATTFNGIVSEASPTYHRAFAPLSQGEQCGLSTTGSATHYARFKFTLAAPTNVTISLLPADGASITPAAADTVMIIYGPGGFDPTDGCANEIMANDDADGSTVLSKIVTTSPLAAGTYTLVVTTFDNEPAAPAALPYVFTGFSSVPISLPQHIVDFDGDGKTDFSVIRNVDGTPDGRLRWYVATNATNIISARDFGIGTDFATPVDFDGDHKTDIAVFRPAPAGSAYFYILQSLTNTVRIVNFGQEGDDASVVGDYDGDGKADLAVYRAGSPRSTWFYLGSLNNPNHNITYVPWGQDGDFPAPGDYDGDGKNDFCVDRDGGAQGIFWLRTAAGATSVTPFGRPDDFIVPGDYDGDGKTDFATVRGVGANMQWQWRSSSKGTINYRTFGLIGLDTPVQGDYDGDGLTDVAVWRPNTQGVFWVVSSSTKTVRTYAFGSGDSDTATGGYNTH